VIIPGLSRQTASGWHPPLLTAHRPTNRQLTPSPM